MGIDIDRKIFEEKEGKRKSESERIGKVRVT